MCIRDRTNAERYITPELKELEDTILGSQDRLVELEYDLFRQIRDTIADNVARIQATARAVAVSYTHLTNDIFYRF